MTAPRSSTEQLRITEAALRKSEERHRLALLAGHLGSWELDLKSMVLQSSDSCKANFGLPPEVELSYSDLVEAILPEDRPCMQASVSQAIESGADYQADYRVRWPDGQIHWVSAYGRPFFSSGGVPMIMLGTTQDITERKRVEEERERLLEEASIARDQAERAVRLRDNFLTSTIHDLRSPLTAMHGRAQLLQRRVARIDCADEDKERLKEGLAQMKAGTAQIEALLAELQDVASLQIGRPLELRHAPTDVNALLQSSIEEMSLQTDNASILFETAHDELVATVDPTRLERVLSNLLSNAVKYSHDGATIVVSLSQDDDCVVVAVRDEGVGIPEPELELIFQRYRRGSNVSESYEGMGIGLAGARSIVEQHGGSLTVESQEGKGSTFTVRIPCSQDPGGHTHWVKN